MTIISTFLGVLVVISISSSCQVDSISSPTASTNDPGRVGHCTPERAQTPLRKIEVVGSAALVQDGRPVEFMRQKTSNSRDVPFGHHQDSSSLSCVDTPSVEGGTREEAQKQSAPVSQGRNHANANSWEQPSIGKRVKHTRDAVSKRRKVDPHEGAKQFSERRKKLTLPRGWSMCRKYGTPLNGTRVFSFKVPLGEHFKVNPRLKFTPEQFLNEQRTHGREIGLVVDLTYTDKYYDGEKEFVSRGVSYIKIPEKGHSSHPRRRNIDTFIKTVTSFLKKNDDNTNNSHNGKRYVAVHCTHGLNRSGFFIVSLLVEALSIPLSLALRSFAAASPPGIWDRDYILALHRKYRCPPPSPELL
eukprot:CAMPEP_0181306276 /NCGR_PEP_ID=MMETSP1101-20121128/10207_1 /TAXON_ID=46948 /ORGANISM="Rhodomonas abbreviata, Strain Caron Lab Isolate" /LENGTH=357 /DNA_ID=CAMNT_0023412309 /DNA_START=425 /DNA_END=1495 /DNA_ORIENTATION=-